MACPKFRDYYQFVHDRNMVDIKKLEDYKSAKKHLNRGQEIDALIWLGHSYRLFEEQIKANQCCHEALHLAKELGDEHRASMALGALEKLSPWIRYKPMRLTTSGKVVLLKSGTFEFALMLFTFSVRMTVFHRLYNYFTFSFSRILCIN